MEIIAPHQTRAAATQRRITPEKIEDENKHNGTCPIWLRKESNVFGCPFSQYRQRVRSKIIVYAEVFFGDLTIRVLLGQHFAFLNLKEALGLEIFKSWNHALLAKTLVEHTRQQGHTLVQMDTPSIPQKGAKYLGSELRRDDSPLFKNLHSIRGHHSAKMWVTRKSKDNYSYLGTLTIE
ncbi:hypothetical protein DH2020_001806 [Rehmannia glutinosa]|uniref:Uncharacterized protein n=1 Tax=Rehmannia glutinosa TaxID=99300 RepID=A0ABR0XRY3_REHGL